MKLNHVILAILVTAIWGFNFVVIDVGLREVPPLTLCFARFFLASIPAVFFVKRPAISLSVMMLFGFVMFALQFSLLFIGMHLGVTAGLASLLIQMQVFFTIFLAILFFNEKITKWQVVGALVSFFGIVVVGLNLGGNISFEGFVLIIAAAASWGAGNLISKQCKNVNMISLVVWGCLFAWPFVLLIALLFEGSGVFYSLSHLSWRSGAVIIYLAYPTTIFGFAVWVWLLARYQAATITPFALLVPVFGMLSSALVLGEPFQVWKILAASLVIAVLCVNLFVPRFVKKEFSVVAAEAEV